MAKLKLNAPVNTNTYTNIDLYFHFIAAGSETLRLCVYLVKFDQILLDYFSLRKHQDFIRQNVRY